MKNLVLVVVPTMENAYHSLQDFVAISPPMGLISIGAMAEKAGYKVSVIDGDAERLTLEETILRVIEKNPNYIGSTIMTATMDITSIFYTKLKEILPNVKVIVGGPHVSAVPEQTLVDAPAIDICVIGEGDETIVDILTTIENGGDIDSVSNIV
ncbi:MAG: cobalamin B12-binding domain-containing protein, partial [Nitrospirae bacterium]|nr:cobalamin B12-binding domain-containing protein [Nitrospirota bacterium]